ncbi:MAG: nicotinamide-nucleotide amidohydrolase family protein [Leptonema sp. (in: Bacteria)]|nr:nicotinamide-nucleotide amidohydrolase family protein [Leptonema sp. (in: bacteria)]
MRTALWVLSTGTELAQGHSRDTNAPEIAAKMADFGFDVAGFSTLPDDPKLILNHFQWLLNQPNIHGFIMTGGLGPTDDDYTIDVLAEWIHSDIFEDSQALERLKAVRLRRRLLDIETARRQVRVLKKAEVIENQTGLAPGVFGRYPDSNFWFVALPGVPTEMRPMSEIALQKLQKQYNTNKVNRFDAYIYEEPESEFQRVAFNKQNSLVPISIQSDSQFRWGVSAKPNVLKVFFEHETDRSMLKTIESALETYYQSRFLLQPIEELLHNLLIEQNLTLSLAESCTGGLIAKLITDIAGSSAYFLGSAVTYSNQTKNRLLNVSNEILEEYGAVSEQCALAMAAGARLLFGSNVAVSVTGIAGPTGGSDQKPVGTVFVAIDDGKSQKVFRLFYPFDREKVRDSTARTVLFRLFRFLTANQS